MLARQQLGIESDDFSPLQAAAVAYKTAQTNAAPVNAEIELSKQKHALAQRLQTRDPFNPENNIKEIVTAANYAQNLRRQIKLFSKESPDKLLYLTPTEQTITTQYLPITEDLHNNYLCELLNLLSQPKLDVQQIASIIQLSIAIYNLTLCLIFFNSKNTASVAADDLMSSLTQALKKQSLCKCIPEENIQLLSESCDYAQINHLPANIAYALITVYAALFDVRRLSIVDSTSNTSLYEGQTPLPSRLSLETSWSNSETASSSASPPPDKPKKIPFWKNRWFRLAAAIIVGILASIITGGIALGVLGIKVIAETLGISLTGTALTATQTGVAVLSVAAEVGAVRKITDEPSTNKILTNLGTESPRLQITAETTPIANTDAGLTSVMDKRQPKAPFPT